jgi:hypothetical protein
LRRRRPDLSLGLSYSVGVTVQRWRRVRQFLATTGVWEEPAADRGPQRWRRVRQFLRGALLGAWILTGFELARGVNGANRPWALAYFIVFGVFLVVDIGGRVVRSQPQSD